MPISFEKPFRRADLVAGESAEADVVHVIGDGFVKHLRSISDQIDEKHVHGASSKEIENLAAEWLVTEHGFVQEEVKTFPNARNLRPDFIGRIEETRRILVEVERGGTVTNNHDLKDLWKCHLHPSMRHLFLLVPNANWAKSGSVRERPYQRVAWRIGTFFESPEAHVNVLSAFVIGYGRHEPVAPELAEKSAEIDFVEADEVARDEDGVETD